VIYSYTFLNTYEICPHQAYRRYVKKDLPFVETEEMKWGTSVHTAMEARLKYGAALPEGMQKYEVFATYFITQRAEPEMNLALAHDGSATMFWSKNPEPYTRGKVDVHWLPNPEIAFIADYKTGKVREEPFELELFGLMLHARYPSLKTIKGRYIWLRDMKLGKEHDLSNTMRTWQDLKSRTNTIENYARMDHWPKRQSPLCGWCNVKDCQFNPEYRP